MGIGTATWDNVGLQLEASLIYQTSFVLLGMLLRVVYRTRQAASWAWIRTYIGTVHESPTSSALLNSSYMVQFIFSSVVCFLYINQVPQLSSVPITMFCVADLFTGNQPDQQNCELHHGHLLCFPLLCQRPPPQVLDEVSSHTRTDHSNPLISLSLGSLLNPSVVTLSPFALFAGLIVGPLEDCLDRKSTR